MGYIKYVAEILTRKALMVDGSHKQGALDDNMMDWNISKTFSLAFKLALM